MFQRIARRVPARSFFLFGARGTGKSTWLREQLPPGPRVSYFDLLDRDVEDRFRLRPGQFADELKALGEQVEWVVVDEVQKLPGLLDTVHAFIESHRFKFALSGSSARKLKAGGANMLGGRAFVRSMFPLTFLELGSTFKLDQILRFGSLPEIFSLKSDADRIEYLASYVSAYLKEEVWAEQLVRKFDPFRKFLTVAAQMNGKIINVAKVARDCGADDKTVASYFDILEDTLLGTHLEAFHSSFRKRLKQKPKFYFFDLGVTQALTRNVHLPVMPQSSGYGEAFEHLVIVEALRLHAYADQGFQFSYLRTEGDAEVALVVERPGKPTLLIEIKSSAPSPVELGKLKRIAQDIKNSHPVCLCTVAEKAITEGVEVWPWHMGLQHFFA
jgi:uncharacterized protein